MLPSREPSDADTVIATSLRGCLEDRTHLGSCERGHQATPTGSKIPATAYFDLKHSRY